MKLSRAGELRALWTHAGLDNVREAPLVIDQAFSSFADYWTPFLKGTGPGGAHVASLSGERRKELEARLRRRLLGDRPTAPSRSRRGPGACGVRFRSDRRRQSLRAAGAVCDYCFFR